MIYLKDPQAILDYGFDWEELNWLEAGESIVTSTWSVPSGITKESDTHNDTTTTIWLSGGTANNDYIVVNHIVTSAGREDDRSHIIRVRDR